MNKTYLSTMRIRISVGDRKKKYNNINDDKNSASPLCANGGQHVCCTAPGVASTRTVGAAAAAALGLDPQLRNTTTRVDVCCSGIKRKNTGKKKIKVRPLNILGRPLCKSTGGAR